MRSQNFNFSKDSEYHSQRNNELIPHGSCNTTSMVMALLQAGWKLPCPGGIQPEDYLTEFLRGEKGYEALRRLAPWAVDRSSVGEKYIYPPNEVHACLAWAVNTIIGTDVCQFMIDIDIDEMAGLLAGGFGIVLSGAFPVGDGELHHVVSLSGYDIDKTGLTDRFIIDDPYGNWKTRYLNIHGNNISMTREEFISIMKEQNNTKKWAHIIRPQVGERDAT